MDSFECFWGRVGARRMKLGDDGLVKGGRSRAELFSRTKDGKILLYPRVDSNSNCTFLGISSFFYCEFVRQSVQFKHISFFSRASRIEKSAAFPNVSRRVWKRLANNFSFRKIGGNDQLPARGRGLASETGAKYGKTGDFRVAERATSRAQLFLGMEIIGTNET